MSHHNQLNGQEAEKEMEAEGENPMTILKYNQVHYIDLQHATEGGENSMTTLTYKSNPRRCQKCTSCKRSYHRPGRASRRVVGWVMSR